MIDRSVEALRASAQPPEDANAWQLEHHAQFLEEHQPEAPAYILDQFKKHMRWLSEHRNDPRAVAEFFETYECD